MLLLKAFVFQNLTDLGQKGRHLVRDNVPQDVFINAEVLMRHDVREVRRCFATLRQDNVPAPQPVYVWQLRR